MNKMSKRFSVVAGAVVLGASLAACGAGAQNTPGVQALQSQQAAQGQDSANLNNNQPTPVFQYSQARQSLINAETIEANGENTTTFGFANNGNLIWECASIGMPVPATAQLTNPEQIIQDPNNLYKNYNPGSLLMPQEEPIGYYSGDTTGTYTDCTNATGAEYLQYWEGYTDSVSGAATYNTTTHQVTMLGKPDPIKASGK